MRTAASSLVLSLLLCVAAACSKGEPSPTSSTSPPTPSASSSSSSTSTATATTSASGSASATTSASASASASDSASPSASSSRKTATASSSSSSPKGAPTCGDKPLPPCPLYAWMKANTSAAMSAQDYDALALALDRTAGFAPKGYGNWVSISKDGADAARHQSLDGVKAACRSCHNQYKNRYKTEMRDRAI